MASPRSLRLLKLFLPISIILFTSAYLFTSSQYDTLPTPSWAKGITKEEEAEATAKKALFIQQASEWEIDGPFNNTALSTLCAGRKWLDGLHFKCAPAYGGVGNVRNIVLTCVRYAIEAGATTLMIPEITVRDSNLINLETGNNMPYGYMFDLEVFNSTLTTACPRIRVISEEDDLAEFPSLLNNTEKLTTKDLGRDFKVDRVVDFPKQWREKFDKWLKKYGAPKGFSAKKPVLVAITPAFFEFPIRYDRPEFIATFGRIVRFRDDLRRIGAVVLYALDKKYKLNFDPTQIGIPVAEKFYGAHLRTDVDAIAASFASYEEQSRAYLAGAKQHKLPFIYLASGSAPDIKRFTKEAKAMKIKVTTKTELLNQAEFKEVREEMAKLTWDQQALVDFAVLLRASHFGGTWASSFAYNIAFRRHIAVSNGSWIHSKAALSAKRDPRVRGDDEDEVDENDEEEEQVIAREVEVETPAAVVRKDGVGFELALRDEDPNALQPGECYKDLVNTVYGPAGMGIWFELSMWP